MIVAAAAALVLLLGASGASGAGERSALGEFPDIRFRPPGSERGEFQEADFVTRTRPASPPPSNLTAPRRALLDRVLRGSDPAPGIAAPLPGAYRRRVDRVIENLNTHVPPLTGPDWDARIGRFSDRYRVEFPAGGVYPDDRWEEGLDRLLASFMALETDPHTDYYDEAALRRVLARMNNEGVTGIGVLAADVREGLRIDRVFPQSPARAAGLLRGDVITHVNGRTLAGLESTEKIERILGPEGTSVRLRLSTGREIVIGRRRIPSRRSFARRFEGGIGYIYFTGFTNGVAEDIIGREPRVAGVEMTLLERTGGLVESLGRLSGLILDVRGNPGGDVAEVSLLVSEFFRDGDPIVELRGPDETEAKVTIRNGRYANLPVAVIIDGGSASASEILAQAMQDAPGSSPRRIVVGTRSFGKGVFQTFRAFPDGTGMRVTNGDWRARGNRDVQADFDPATQRNVAGTGGVIPDIDVEPELARLSEAQLSAIGDGIMDQLYGESSSGAAVDPALARALGALRGR